MKLTLTFPKGTKLVSLSLEGQGSNLQFKVIDDNLANADARMNSILLGEARSERGEVYFLRVKVKDTYISVNEWKLVGSSPASNRTLPQGDVSLLYTKENQNTYGGTSACGPISVTFVQRAFKALEQGRTFTPEDLVQVLREGAALHRDEDHLDLEQSVARVQREDSLFVKTDDALFGFVDFEGSDFTAFRAQTQQYLETHYAVGLVLVKSPETVAAIMTKDTSLVSSMPDARFFVFNSHSKNELTGLGSGAHVKALLTYEDLVAYLVLTFPPVPDIPEINVFEGIVLVPKTRKLRPILEMPLSDPVPTNTVTPVRSITPEPEPSIVTNPPSVNEDMPKRNPNSIGYIKALVEMDKAHLLLLSAAQLILLLSSELEKVSPRNFAIYASSVACEMMSCRTEPKVLTPMGNKTPTDVRPGEGRNGLSLISTWLLQKYAVFTKDSVTVICDSRRATVALNGLEMTVTWSDHTFLSKQPEAEYMVLSPGLTWMTALETHLEIFRPAIKLYALSKCNVEITN